MTLNLSSTNTTPSTTTADVHNKTADTINNNTQTIQKIIRIQLQTLLLIMMLNNLKHQEKYLQCHFIRCSRIFRNNINTEIIWRNLHMTFKKLPPPGKQYFCFQIDGKSSRAVQCSKSCVLTKVFYTITDIDLFEHKYVIFKELLQS